MPPSSYCQEHYPDDPAILDEVQLLRRVPRRHFFWDENLGRTRPSSAAFEDDTDREPMSVYRRNILEVESGGVARVMMGHEGFALAGLAASEFRVQGQSIHPEPVPDEPAHTVVCGDKPERVRKLFAKRALWVIEPPEQGRS